MCKSGIQYNSDSDTDEDGTFHSIGEKNYKERQNKNTSKNGQSKLSLTLSINQGLLSIYTPVRDSMRNVIPGQQGELIIRLEDATLFSVTSYKGDANLSYLCAMIKNATLNHCGLMTSPSNIPLLRSVNNIIPRHCKKTIYRTESDSSITMNSVEKDMISLAVKIQAAHQTHRIKTFRVAIGIRNSTLRHRMSSTSTSWFTQLTDCFDVVDYPVAGYLAPGILTELHLHLWDCAVDYRPLNLPLRSIVTLGNFSVSSNIAAQTNTSTLRFIAEDVALFISNKLERNVNLRKDYICVINLGLFELSLRLNDKMCGGAPRVDLRASNNMLHVRTCSDSARALTQLLTYFASDGDLLPNTKNTDSIIVPSSKEEETLLNTESINTLSKSQIERVYNLMEDAMEETINKPTESVDRKKTSMTENQIEVFFFPGETCLNSQTSEIRRNSRTCSNTNRVLVKDIVTYNMEIYDSDEEFCILGEEAGTGIIPRHGVPEVRWLCQESLRIVDNHFPVPLGRTDLLKAPPNFPAPVLRYTLCEMTLIWHMYGGRDFEGSQSQPKKHVTINDNTRYNIVHGRYETCYNFLRKNVCLFVYVYVNINNDKFCSIFAEVVLP